MVGGYDESLKATEDVDICQRVALSGWALFFEPEAKCVHASRTNVKDLARQWFTYGYWSAFVLKKNKGKRCEVFVSLSSRPRINRYLRILGTDRSPFPALVFLSYFPIMNLIGVAALLSLAKGFGLAAFLLCFVLGLLALGLNLSNPVLRSIPFKRRVDYWCMTYLINASCMLGSFIGGIRCGMLYFYPGL